MIQADYAPKALAAWSASYGLAGVSVEHFLLTPRLAQPLQFAGLSINTGTVNDAELLARVARHADAVCTDRLGELRNAAQAAAAATTATPPAALGA